MMEKLLKRGGRPTNESKQVKYDALMWEPIGSQRLGYTTQSLQSAYYPGNVKNPKTVQVFKQVVRLKNGNCIALFYYEFSKSIHNNEQSLINEVHQYYKRIKHD